MKFPISNFKFPAYSEARQSRQISNFVLAILLVLGLFLRVYQVSSVPPGLTWDEAALGYNAYSILKTGRDEYGVFLPINLKSFGDYKPALYTYLDIPFVTVLGLTEMAVRLPSVIAGGLFILLIYLLVKELFKEKWLALSCALFASISPLSLQFSRTAFESNIATVLNLAGVYFFLKGQKNNLWYLGSFGVFGLSLLTYQGSRLFVPLLLIGLILFFRKSTRFVSKGFLGGLGLFGVLGVIVGVSIFWMGQGSRLQTANFFAYTRSDEQINQILQEDGISQGSIYFQTIHGEWFAYIRGLVERYVVYFTPKMLFLEGDYDLRHKVPDMGVLPYSSLFFFAFGIYFLATKWGKAAGLVVLYLAIAPLPGVLSRDLINMVRSLNLVVPFTILEGAGFYFLWQLLSRRKIFGYLGLLGVLGVLGFVYGMFLDSYFVHATREYSQGYLYGYKQSLLLADARNKQKWDQYDQVVMTDTYGQPYIYYLFYSQYPPEKYQQQAKLEQNSVDVGQVHKIDNIEFRHIFWPGDRGSKNSLFIGTVEELPDQDVKPFKEFNLVGDVNFLDGSSAFRVVETKP